jgi:hypothetical protein
MLVKQYQVVVRDAATRKELKTVSFVVEASAHCFKHWVEQHVIPGSTMTAVIEERVVRQ